jgi:vesicle transport protein SEC22
MCSDTFIQKTKKLYMDTKSQRNLNKISTDLKDIERLMTKNIQDILGRGAKIDGSFHRRQTYFLPTEKSHPREIRPNTDVASKSSRLASSAKDFRSDAIRLNQLYWWRTYGPIIGVVAFFLLVLIIRYFFF